MATASANWKGVPVELVEVQKEADNAGRKAIVLGLAALMLAIGFGWLLANLGGGGPETQPLVVAKDAIPALTSVRAEQLKIVDWPATALPKGGFHKIEEITSSNKITVVGLEPNEPILDSRLSTPDRGIGVSQLIEPNMRAYVVSVNDYLAKAQIIRPGAFVDVVAVLDKCTRDHRVAKIILQNIQVLAVGERVDVTRSDGKEADTDGVHDQSEGYRVVTLLIQATDVEIMVLATTEGRIDLALRSGRDSEIVTTTGADSNKVFGGHNSDGAESEAPPPPMARSPRPRPHVPAAVGPSIYKVHR